MCPCLTSLSSFPSSPFLLCVGTSFQRVYVDRECGEGVKVQRVLFCTGKIHYELYKERQRLGLTNKVAIIRIEQVEYLCRHIYDL